MKFTISKKRLLAASAAANSIAPRTDSMPIAGEVLITADGDAVTFTSTDLAMFRVDRAEANVATAGGACTSAKRLHDIVKTLGSGDVTVELLANYWMSIKSGRSTFRVPAHDAKEFVEVPQLGGAYKPFDSAMLSRILDRTVYSVCVDAARVNLCNLLLEGADGKLRAVGTDGHRMTKAEAKVDGFELDGSVLLPRKAAVELHKFCGKSDSLKLQVRDGYILVGDEASAVTLAIRTPQNITFPPYEKVIPEKWDSVASAARDDLLLCVRQAMVLAPEKTTTVRVDFMEGLLRMTASQPECGGESEHEVEMEHDGSPMQIGLNGHYVVDAIEQCKNDDVTIRLQGPLDSAVIVETGDVDYWAVVMPIRL